MRTEEDTLPEHVTMPLLDRLIRQSLDDEYHETAERRTAAKRSPVAGWGAVVPLVLLGLLVTVAAVQTARTATTTATSRAALVERINAGKEQVVSQQERLRELRETNAALQRELDDLAERQDAQEDAGTRLARYTGFAPVTGEGVRVTVTDGPGATDTTRVRDEDLSLLVSGLWSAGAEAISINGHRLTAIAPIRTSGMAIHVANEPVRPPYEILALGDTSTLQSRLAETTHGLEWYQLRATYGFGFEMTNEEELQLPGSRLPVLRSVTAVTDTRAEETP
jgi:uncharacterized protein YlxW (UPF0749 family)